MKSEIQAGMIDIVVYTMEGKELPVVTRADSSVAELTEIVNDALRLSPDKVAKLVTTDATLLEPASSPLTAFGITSGAKLTATIQPTKKTERRRSRSPSFQEFSRLVHPRSWLPNWRSDIFSATGLTLPRFLCLCSRDGSECIYGQYGGCSHHADLTQNPWKIPRYANDSSRIAARKVEEHRKARKQDPTYTKSEEDCPDFDEDDTTDREGSDEREEPPRRDMAEDNAKVSGSNTEPRSENRDRGIENNIDDVGKQTDERCDAVRRVFITDTKEEMPPSTFRLVKMDRKTPSTSSRLFASAVKGISKNQCK